MRLRILEAERQRGIRVGVAGQIVEVTDDLAKIRLVRPVNQPDDAVGTVIRTRRVLGIGHGVLHPHPEGVPAPLLLPYVVETAHVLAGGDADARQQRVGVEEGPRRPAHPVLGRGVGGDVVKP